MNKEIVLSELDELIKEGDMVLSTKEKGNESTIFNFVNAEEFYGWRTKALSFLKLFLPDDNKLIESFIRFPDPLVTNVIVCHKALENIKSYVEKDFFIFEQRGKVDTDSVLDTIFSRFRKVAMQLRNRYGNRETLEVNDEYDVQNLLHALLQLYFDDIRSEEWTPSYAGQCARMDFLLKNEKVVIEVKKTRENLKDKDVGNQLIEDIERYKEHPDCERLICFVYDPEGFIGNPKGLMADLNKKHEGFATVIIKPDM